MFIYIHILSYYNLFLYFKLCLSVVSFWKESFNGDGKLNHYIQYQQTQQPPLTSNHWTITSNINKPNNHLLPQITELLHPISINPTTTSYLKSLNHYIQYQQTQQPPLTSNYWTKQKWLIVRNPPNNKKIRYANTTLLLNTFFLTYRKQFYDLTISQRERL
jgi:hypothetical protein